MWQCHLQSHHLCCHVAPHSHRSSFFTSHGNHTTNRLGQHYITFIHYNKTQKVKTPRIQKPRVQIHWVHEQIKQHREQLQKADIVLVLVRGNNSTLHTTHTPHTPPHTTTPHLTPTTPPHLIPLLANPSIAWWLYIWPADVYLWWFGYHGGTSSSHLRAVALLSL